MDNLLDLATRIRPVQHGAHVHPRAAAILPTLHPHASRAGWFEANTSLSGGTLLDVRTKLDANDRNTQRIYLRAWPVILVNNRRLGRNESCRNLARGPLCMTVTKGCTLCRFGSIGIDSTGY